MAGLRHFARRRLSSETFDIRLAQLVCFAASPALLLCAVFALQRHAATPGEVVVGLLAAVAVSIQCIILGIVLPMARDRSSL